MWNTLYVPLNARLCHARSGLWSLLRHFKGKTRSFTGAGASLLALLMIGLLCNPNEFLFDFWQMRPSLLTCRLRTMEVLLTQKKYTSSHLPVCWETNPSGTASGETWDGLIHPSIWIPLPRQFSFHRMSYKICISETRCCSSEQANEWIWRWGSYSVALF